MNKKFKHNLENSLKNLAVASLIAGSMILYPFQKIKTSTELPKQYTLEEVKKIQRDLEEKFRIENSQPITPKEKEELFNYVFKNISNLPSYLNRKYLNAKIEVESEGNPYAISKVGARGLMQLMENTWRGFSSENYNDFAFNPRENLLTGLKYLKQIDSDLKKNYSRYSKLSDKKKQNLMSAVYNAGLSRVKKAKYNIENLSKETRNHVEKIRKKIH